jgi:hypothetical protein
LKNKIMHVLAGITLAGATLTASAYDEPNVNFGATSFLDGAPPAGPGWYFMEYLQQYSASKFKDGNGNALALPKQDVNVSSSLSQLIYLSNYQIGNAKLGAQIIVPAVLAASTDDGLNHAALSSRRGIGDVIAGAVLQFDPIMGADGPRYVQRLEAAVIAPTGAYDPAKSVNPGSNFWSFNPYWAATAWMSPKWTVSWRAHYLWNGKNTNPSTAFGPGVSSTQAGQAFHINLASEYAVTPKLRLGINSYWFDQFTDTKINGQDAPGRRERVLGIGPGAVYSFSKEDHVFLNTYFETGVRNRPEGTRIVLRFAHQL